MSKKISPQTRLVLEVLSSSECHLTAEQILGRLPDASPATVYRSLETLVSERMIRRLSLNGNKAVYEFVRRPHLHFICTRCHQINDIHVDITEMVRAAAECMGERMDYVDTTAYGLCSRCLKEMNFKEEISNG